MCVEWTGQWKVADEKITAYKVVSVGMFPESYGSLSLRRDLQHGDDHSFMKHLDVHLKYEIGQTVVAPDGSPGIYLFRQLRDAVAYRKMFHSEFCILEVLIEVGTKIRDGCIEIWLYLDKWAADSYTAPTINAVSVLVCGLPGALQ